MKKLVFIFIFCFICFGFLDAQDIWKNINLQGDFLGASADGSLFARPENGGLSRSTDEGVTWEIVVGEGENFSTEAFTINKNNRIFAFNNDTQTVYYSDDNGDSWQQTSQIPQLSPGPYLNYPFGLHSSTNDVLVGWIGNQIFWTIDTGATWLFTELSMNYHQSIGDVVVKDNGDVFASILWFYDGDNSGIFYSTLSDMQSWELVAFQGASIHQMVFHPDGSIIASNFGGQINGFHQELGFYLVDGLTTIPRRSNDLAVSEHGITYHLQQTNGNHVRLYYSRDHGEHFHGVGDELIFNSGAGGERDGYLFKGNDNHLYYVSDYTFKKSKATADEAAGIIGTLTKMEAPFFENNASDVRFAITTDLGIYYTMVDGYWPDSKAEELIIKYDTVPLGTEIEVSGTYYEMADDNGNVFNVIDIQNYINKTYSYITGYLIKWYVNDPPTLESLENIYYYVAVDGELLTETPLVFNGYTINSGSGVYTFIGIAEIWPGYEHPVLNLIDVFPGNVQGPVDVNTRTVIGSSELCLTTPGDEQRYLSYNDGTTVYYLTRKGKLLDEDYYNALFNEDVITTLVGKSGVHYDLYGAEFQTVEVLQLETVGERTLHGKIQAVTQPSSGAAPPIVLTVAILQDGFTYFMDNLNGFYEYAQNCIFNGDTIAMGLNVSVKFSTSYRAIRGFNNVIFKIHLDELVVIEPEESFPIGSEWFYELNDDDGNISYQHLQCVGDTTIGNEKPKIIVRTNQIYDKDSQPVISHEYIYERNGFVYWWNKELQQFTVLYNLYATLDSYWEIKVGTESIIVFVDGVDDFVYEGETHRRLHVYDVDDLFTGYIVADFGHMTSFFPEKLMNKNKGFQVDGLRCYWLNDELVFHNGNEDCDAIHSVINMVDEMNAESDFMIYPNPTNGIITVETQCVASLPSEYRITNLMGQTLMTGPLPQCDSHTINVSSLPSGMYFITIGKYVMKLIIMENR